MQNENSLKCYQERLTEDISGVYLDMLGESRLSPEEIALTLDNAFSTALQENYSYFKEQYERAKYVNDYFQSKDSQVYTAVIETDAITGEMFFTIPEHIRNKCSLSPGDEVEWVDQKDGSYLLRKVIQ
jgi:hypothetical protein